MEKYVKIAEINADSPNSAKEIAETLENKGFVVACEETEGYCATMTVLRVITQWNQTFIGE